LDAQDKISSFLLPQLPLEIAIIKATGQFPEETQESSQPPAGRPLVEKSQFKTQNVPTKAESPEPSMPITKEAEVSEEKISEKNGTALSIESVHEKWNHFLEEMKPHNHSLKALLSNCQISSVNGQEVMLCTSYDFYKDRLNDAGNRATMEKVLGQILGQKVILRTVTNKEAGRAETKKDAGDPPASEAGKKNTLLQSALEILGGKVVDEK